jgi:glycosyltransferase AglE
MRKSISIIIPIYNTSDNLNLLIESLINQNYPEKFYEIIAVDNNSTDGSDEIIKTYPQVKLLYEKERQSSYAARNLGILHSKYDIMAFIDSDCIASENWLQEAIHTFNAFDADLVGGNVVFRYSMRKSSFEILDSITHMQIEHNITKQGIAKTANLFVKRGVFDKIGLFNTKLKSGGDVEWTWKAVKKNYKLTYSQKAIVYHPARNAKELLRKQFRIGQGQIAVWKNKGYPFYSIFFNICKDFLPSSIIKLRKKLISKNLRVSPYSLTGIFFASYFMRLFGNFGRIYHLLSFKK